jgi:NAD(P)-dependent dehydrogenase (short-subunit alcohol dehydrogenase family)
MAIKTNLFDLTNQVAFITGGASGIGKAIAEVMVLHGAKVFIGSRTQEKVDKAIIEISRATEADEADPAEPIVSGMSLDVTSDDSVEAAVKQCVDTFGRVDILVNCAGVIIKKPTFDLTMDEFNLIHESHVTGSLRCAQAVGHLMREQHSGSIINIASISSFVDLVEVAAYAAAKNAVMGLTRSLANEWAKYGIRTNAIAPGFIPTDLNRQFLEGTDRGRRIMEHTPMGRWGKSEEIAPAAVYLASPAASFVNGHTLLVDGGYLACGIGDQVAEWAGEEEDAD